MKKYSLLVLSIAFFSLISFSLISSFNIESGCVQGQVNGTHYCGVGGTVNLLKQDLCEGNLVSSCDGAALSCNNFGIQDCEDQEGCYLDRTLCTGVAKSCDRFYDNMDSCNFQEGCSVVGINCSDVLAQNECNTYSQCNWIIPSDAVPRLNNPENVGGSCVFGTGSINSRSEYCSKFDGDSQTCLSVGCSLEYPSCVENYECFSGECRDGFCKSDYKEIAEHTNFLRDFFDRVVSYFTGGEGEILDTAPPVVTLNSPSSDEFYYSDDEIVVSVNVVDESNEVEWRIIDEGQRIYGEGVLTGEDGVNANAVVNLGSMGNVYGGAQEIELYFDAVDENGLRSAMGIVFSVRNENCEDGIDNDGDGVTDELDLDCAEEGAQTIEVSDIFVGSNSNDNEIYTHRKMDVSCQYEVSGSVSNDNIFNCVEMSFGGFSGESVCDRRNSLSGNWVRYENCDVGGEGREIEVSCYINPYCNSNDYGSLVEEFSVVKYSICDAGEMNVEELPMSLIEPDDNDRFESGEEVDIEIEVDNLIFDEDESDVVVKTYFYDIDEEERVSNIGSLEREIEQFKMEEYNLNVTIYENVDEDNSHRLYYKAYLKNNEDVVCVSDSIGVRLRETRSCVDKDGDGYCDYEDCNDDNEFIHPRAPEICTDNIDNDCDGLIDDMDSDCNLGTPGLGGPRDVIPGIPYNAGTISTIGVRVLMQTGSQVNFKLDSGDHSLKVKSISGSDVLLTISSEPFDVLIRPNEIKDVDVDKDGNNDLRLKLEGFVTGKIDLTIRSIFYSSTPGDSINLPGSGGNVGSNGSSVGTWIMIFIIFILIVGVSIFLYLRYMKDRKSFDFLTKGKSGSKPNGPPKRPFPPRGSSGIKLPQRPLLGRLPISQNRPNIPQRSSFERSNVSN